LNRGKLLGPLLAYVQKDSDKKGKTRKSSTTNYFSMLNFRTAGFGKDLWDYGDSAIPTCHRKEKRERARERERERERKREL